MSAVVGSKSETMCLVPRCCIRLLSCVNAVRQPATKKNIPNNTAKNKPNTQTAATKAALVVQAANGDTFRFGRRFVSLVRRRGGLCRRLGVVGCSWGAGVGLWWGVRFERGRGGGGWLLGVEGGLLVVRFIRLFLLVLFLIVASLFVHFHLVQFKLISPQLIQLQLVLSLPIPTQLIHPELPHFLPLHPELPHFLPLHPRLIPF